MLAMRPCSNSGVAALIVALSFAGLVAARAGQAQSTEPAEPLTAASDLAPPATVTPDSGASSFKLTPEQQERLRAAREAELRQLLGLASAAPLPSAAELSDAQRQMIRDARDAEMRRVLGLAPGDPIPDRVSVTEAQRQRIAAAHEARIREALGLAADAPLERVPTAGRSADGSTSDATAGGAASNAPAADPTPPASPAPAGAKGAGAGPAK